MTRVLVLDTGCDIKHEAVKNNICGCYNTIKENEDVFDVYGHGTHVSSIITSLAPDCELYICKVLDDRGGGDYKDIKKGFGYALQLEPDIINVSLGGAPDELLHNLVKACRSKGMNIICAAGYDNIPIYPGGFEECLSVGAMDYDYNICEFNAPDSLIDVYAPGLDILGAKTNTNEYKTLSGSSQATAYVSGVLASLDNNMDELYKMIQNKFLQIKK